MTTLRLAPPVSAPRRVPHKTRALKPHLPSNGLYFPNFHKTPSAKTSITTYSSLPSPTPPLAAPTDLLERDWSFLDPDDSDPTRSDKTDRVINSARLGPDSRVLISFGSVRFVERVVDSGGSTRPAAAIHESLLALALIKEKHDAVRCWQGGVEAVPERFGPFDAVFVCYFPGIGVPVDQLLDSLANRCSPGARVVISYDQGREIIEQDHRQQYPDMVTYDLPDRITLEKAATHNAFEITEFVDEPTFYLAVLKFSESGIKV